MIAEAKDYLLFDPWLVNLPGGALFILVMGLNLLGDALQPRARA
jgi:peptide/nickel transport system permease protein